MNTLSPYLMSADSLLELIKEQEAENVDNDTNEMITTGTSLDESLANLKSAAGTLTFDIMHWGGMVISMLFILGVLMMILSILFRNGQWQKWGQGTMLVSFVSLLAIRGIP